MLKQIFIEDILPIVIDIFQKKVLTFNISTPQTGNINPPNTTSPVPLNDKDVIRLFGWAIMKTIKRYSKLKDAISSGGDDIKTMLEDMITYVTSILHNKEYVRLYYPMDDAIINRGQLILISTP